MYWRTEGTEPPLALTLTGREAVAHRPVCLVEERSGAAVNQGRTLEVLVNFTLYHVL